MPDDKKTQPNTNVPELTDAIQPKAELPRDEVMRLPTGYQKIHLRALMPKPIADALLVPNKMFGSRETARGCGKPISKIVECEEPGNASGQ
jgi:hypothetical protein